LSQRYAYRQARLNFEDEDDKSLWASGYPPSTLELPPSRRPYAPAVQVPRHQIPDPFAHARQLLKDRTSAINAEGVWAKSELVATIEHVKFCCQQNQEGGRSGSSAAAHPGAGGGSLSFERRKLPTRQPFVGGISLQLSVLDSDNDVASTTPSNLGFQAGNQTGDSVSTNEPKQVIFADPKESASVKSFTSKNQPSAVNNLSYSNAARVPSAIEMTDSCAVEDDSDCDSWEDEPESSTHTPKTPRLMPGNEAKKGTNTRRARFTRMKKVQSGRGRTGTASRGK